MLAARLDALYSEFSGPGLLLTPLAEGADRLAAHRALAAGWSLEAVLPFPAIEYEADFHAPVTPGVSGEACIAEFRKLLRACERVVVLPYSREPDPLPGYDAAGRHVVDHADALIGIWDGVRTNKRAGTSATIEYARALGKRLCILTIPGEQ